MSFNIEEVLFLVDPDLAQARLIPEAKERVISAIAGLNLRPATKRFLYARWARTVGISVEPADLARAAPAPPGVPAPPS
jgi:hypothetical protein